MRNEKGSITLFVLVSMLFFLIIATTAYVSASNKLKGQNEELAQIKASYEQDLSDEALLQLYNKVTKTREWLAGSGTQEDTYKIYTIEDLVVLSNRTNSGEDFTDKYVELMNDLDFKRDSSYAKADRTDFGDVNEDGTVQDLKTELTTGQGFIPIGKTRDLAFKGTFEGNDYTIKHLHIDRETSFIGLFGNSYTVQNLTVKDGYVRGASGTGGIVGVLRSGKMENCHNDNTTVILKNGNYYCIGGVLGQCSTGTNGISNCSNSGKIIANGISSDYSNGSGCGGVVGKLGNNIFCRGLINTGSVESKGCIVGGVIGEGGRESTADSCCNSGAIVGFNDHIGGIAGSTGGTVEKCYNTGTITQKSGSKIGGIVGSTYTNTSINILNCYNKGKIIEEENNSNGIGGIIGWIKNEGTTGEIKNNYNAGEIKITGTNVQNVGGVVGIYETTNFAIDNNYYEINKCNATLNGIATGLELSNMQLQSFVDLLNSGQTDIPWAMDTTNKNNGYPVLKWQTE